MSALERVESALAAHGSRKSGGNWNCPGPLHANGDRNPSLHLTSDSRGVAMLCHAGCDTKEVLGALGLGWEDLSGEPYREVERYPYSRDGRWYEKVRLSNGVKKTFRWEPSLNGCKMPLYRLDEALSLPDPVYVIESEKDVNTLLGMGVAATCVPGGAGDWNREYTGVLRGREVIIVADRDEPGVNHAGKVQAALSGTAASVRVMQSATTGEHDDVGDHLDAGFTLEQLVLFRPQSEIGTEKDLVARIRRGGCILDVPKVPDAVWGKGEDIFWASGQSLIIAGHDGTGKTTLAGNLIRARLGLGDGTVLGLPVRPGRQNVLVLMMDRPRQAMSSLARLFGDADRDKLEERLRVWEGPPPEDLALNPRMLEHLCLLANADTCVVDSLKDAAIPLTEDAVGAGWNRARQAAIVSGVELLELHHPRKPMMQDINKPPELNDLYGSRWIPAGIGSAIVLHGRAGEPYVKLYHRKPVVSLLGPWDLLLREDGEIVISGDRQDILKQISRCGHDGITAAQLALLLYDSDGHNETERARRQLERLNKEGSLTRHGGVRGGSAAVYKVTSNHE